MLLDVFSYVCSVFIFIMFSYFREIETNLVRCKSVIHIAFSLNYLVMSTVLNFLCRLEPTVPVECGSIGYRKAHQCDYDPCASGSRHGKKENWRGSFDTLQWQVASCLRGFLMIRCWPFCN